MSPKTLFNVRSGVPPGGGGDVAALEDVFNALAVLQNTYFDPVNGTWPKSIDWTGAVVGTIISDTLSTLTESLESVERDRGWNQKEQLISSIFAQVAHSFFGQNAAAILDEVRGSRRQAPFASFIILGEATLVGGHW